METYSINLDRTRDVPLFLVKGYFNREAGLELQKEIQALLSESRVNMIIDFGDCAVVNSPGVALLLDAVLQVHEDFKGIVVLSRLDALKKRVFSMAGILEMVREAPDLDTALKSFG